MNIAAGPEQPEVEQRQENKEPWRLTLPDRESVFVGELAEPGEWIVANIQTNSTWPVNAQKVMYHGRAFWILPLMQGFYPAVAMKVPPGSSRLECEKLLMRFVSNLSWVEDHGFIVEYLSGGSQPVPIGRDKERGFSICEEFDLSYFPEPASERALLALALMREGRGLNHPAYAFLSFFRVLEVAFPNGKARESWVNANAPLVRGFQIPEALAGIRAKGITEIGAHLYESGRCAIAHASREPIVDPDDPSELRRLQSELPIMTALAQKAIEEELGVESSHTVYRKHLYELTGFKEIFGPDMVEYLMRGEEIPDDRTVSMPKINVEIRKHAPYAPLSNLSVKQIAQNGKVLYIRFESNCRDVVIQFQLDFGNERLEYSFFRDLCITDTGSAESAERIAEIKRFDKEYFGNGELHIFNAETGDLIARKDAFIPLNMYLDVEAADALIAAWKRLAEQRRERDRHYAEEMARLSVPYDVHCTLRFTDYQMQGS